MKQTIEVFYMTGDSFSNENTQNEIPVVFESEKALQEAIKDIEEHNAYYEKMDSYGISFAEKQALYTEMKQKRWFVPSIEDFADYSDEEMSKMLSDETCTKEYEKILSGDLQWNEDYIWESYIYLFDDEGKKHKVHVFWQGYFEKFYNCSAIEA